MAGCPSRVTCPAWRELDWYFMYAHSLQKSLSKTTFRAAWAPLCLADFTLACNATFLIFIQHILVFHFYFYLLLTHKRFDFFGFFFFKTFFSVIRSVIQSGPIWSDPDFVNAT